MYTVHSEYTSRLGFLPQLMIYGPLACLSLCRQNDISWNRRGTRVKWRAVQSRLEKQSMPSPQRGWRGLIIILMVMLRWCSSVVNIMGTGCACNYKFIVSVISISLINIRQQLTNVFHLAGLLHCLQRSCDPRSHWSRGKPWKPSACKQEYLFSLAMLTAEWEYCLFQIKGRNWNILCIWT